jgi:hypothetical protein
MKMAAMPSNVTSVITALPFLTSSPPTAGSKARTRGRECQWELSSCSPKSCSVVARGKRRSSVEERIDLRASENPSDRNELLLRSAGRLSAAANVEARLSGLCRRPSGDGLLWRLDKVGGGNLTSKGFSEVVIVIATQCVTLGAI